MVSMYVLPVCICITWLHILSRILSLARFTWAICSFFMLAVLALFTYTVGVKKSSGFPAVVRSKNALSVAILHPFFHTRHKHRTAVLQPYRFYGGSVQFACFRLRLHKNGCTMTALCSGDRLKKFAWINSL